MTKSYIVSKAFISRQRILHITKSYIATEGSQHE
jgi:hypothetical protein